MKGPLRRHPTPPAGRLYYGRKRWRWRLSLSAQAFGQNGAEFPRLKRIGTQGTF